MAGHNVFISYKYKDARSYVDEIQKKLENTVIIDKSESDDESLAGKTDQYIASKLSDKIFPTTVTIVLLSKNMKDATPERDQWIPWEVSYSLRKDKRNGIQSSSNALIYVDLPDNRTNVEIGKYLPHFEIISKNLKNGYALLVNWSDFIAKPHWYIDRSIQKRDNFTDVLVKTP